MAGQSFYNYFREAMASVGLPAPESLWGTATAATATLKALLNAATSIGARATATELVMAAEAGANAGVGAAVAEGALVGIGGVLASFYLGACVGAFLYATERSLSDRFFSRVSTRAISDKANALNLDIPYQIRGKIAAANKAGAGVG